ncbi:hypothetical protein HRbin08_01520 [bacterium HR08]|nr:hypothetical protein HRbin08_01520 [bacterium HR08]
MNSAVRPAEWYRAFQREVRLARWADPLREAALKGHLGAWTRHLTGAVIVTCQAMGWRAVGRGHLAEVLPVVKQEYLALDIMAFPADRLESWPRPVAVFELENQQREDRIAYALWKVSLVRCFLKGIFCYRKRPEEIGDLLEYLAERVMAVAGAGEEPEAVLIVVGTRSRTEDFPDGFFKPYRWDGQRKQFRPLL